MDQAKVVDAISKELERIEDQSAESTIVDRDDLLENPFMESEMKQLYAEADQAIAGATKSIEVSFCELICRTNFFSSLYSNFYQFLGDDQCIHCFGSILE
jgi:methionine synthase II (cobalamin-independent)